MTKAINHTALGLRAAATALLGILIYCYLFWLSVEPATVIQHLISKYQLHNQAINHLARYYFVANVTVLLFAGILVDRFRPSTMIAIGLVISIIANFMFGYGATFQHELFSRELMGASSAILTIAVFKLGAVWLPRRYFMLYVAMLLVSAIMASFFGTAILSHLVETENWKRAIFVTNVFGMVLLFVSMLLYSNKTLDGKILAQATWSDTMAALSEPKLWLTGFVLLCGSLFFTAFISQWGLQYLTYFFQFTKNIAAKLTVFPILGFCVGILIAAIIATFMQRKRILLMTGLPLAAILIFWFIYAPMSSYPGMGVLLFCIGVLLGAVVVCYGITYEYSTMVNIGFALSLVLFVERVGSTLLQFVPPLVIETLGKQAWPTSLLFIPVALLLGAGLSYRLKTR